MKIFFTLTNLLITVYLSANTISNLFFERQFQILEGHIVVVTPLLCHGDQNAVLRAESDGNPSTTSYMWSNGATSKQIGNLGSGVYTVTITDAAGGSAVVSQSLVEPDLIISGTSVTNILCPGFGSGSISTNISGGKPPYQIIWSNGATTTSINNLPTGFYSLTITDNNNCSITQQFNINQPDDYNIDAMIFDNLCFNRTEGSINLSVSGGTEPYTIMWNDGTNEFERTELSAGIYSYTITDLNNCNISSAFTIAQPDQITLTAIVNAITDIPGGVQLDITGGVNPYEIIWTGPEGFSSENENIQVSVAGEYSIQVTDANGCTLMQSFFVDNMVNVRDSDVLKGISAFPNPTNGFLNVLIPSDLNIEQITCIAADGRIIPISNNLMKTDLNLRLDVHHLNTGLYNLNVRAVERNLFIPFIKTNN
ncbi:MAG: SprB repeat-containing protein [Saprospiraceae bacterium]|nr:SprB repeat-containing protein [Saprospiraceae bacterium]